MKRIHLGVVGAGSIADEHLRTLSRRREVKSISVYDPMADRAGKLAATYGGTVAATLPDLVEQSDLVWICAPPFAHVEPVQLACAAGKAVFCEKPLALTLEQMRQIVRAVEKTGTPFFMGQSGRFTPIFRKIKALVEQGVIGEPTLVWSNRVGYLAGPAATPWRLDDRQSGGVIIEFGIHELDFVRWIGGDFATLHAQQSAKVIKPGQFTDTATITGQLVSGALAQVHISWANPRYEWRRGVQGTEGALFYDDSTFNQVMVCKHGKPPRAVTVPPTYWKHPETQENVSFMEQATAIFKALATGTAPEVGLAVGVGTLTAALAATRSATTGKIVTVTATPKSKPTSKA